jgi:hypothetical protein
MAPSSGTIPRLDELIKPFLLEGRSEWHTFLLLATLAVVVGVALEVWEIFHDVREEIDHNRGIARTRLLTLSGEGIPVIEHRHTWMKTLGAVGWIFVVLGVAGEFEFDSIISDFDNGIRLIDDSLLRQARSESTDANVNAALATQEATRADARTLREIEARSVIEKQLVWMGPRQLLIEAAHAQFDKYLKQFEGQSAIVVACGAQVTLGDQETTITAGDLNSALKEAGWNVDTLHSLSIDRACFPGAESIVVFRRSDAPIATRDAALTLVAVIDTVLSQLVEPIVPNRPVDFTLNGAVVASDTIEVLVQRHPMRPTGPSQGDTKLLKRVSSSGLSRRPKRDPARQR